MMEIKDDKCLVRLRSLETDGRIAEALRYNGSSSWVSLKNLIFESSVGQLDALRARAFAAVSWRGLRLALLSMCSYFRVLAARKPVVVFVTAGSGILKVKGRVYDSYLPPELWSEEAGFPDSVLYLVSASRVEDLSTYTRYLTERRAVVFSLLVSPLRALLGRVVMMLLRVDRRLVLKCRESSYRLRGGPVEIRASKLLSFHARFVAGVMLYRAFFYPFRITKAYVVSAYSNSEICAVMKSRGVQVVEIQHGLVGRAHRGYNYAVPRGILPTPDVVRVYNEFWREELLAGGYFGAANVEISPRLKYRLAEGEPRRFSFDYVVFTGQGICLSQVESFIREFGEAATSLHLVYVPHPSEVAESIARLKAAIDRPGIHVLVERDCTTERLIQDSVAHVSIYSSCHFDAVHFKGKTYILDVIADNPMYFYARSRSEQFVLINTVDALLNRVGRK